MEITSTILSFTVVVAAVPLLSPLAVVVYTGEKSSENSASSSTVFAGSSLRSRGGGVGGGGFLDGKHLGFSVGQINRYKINEQLQLCFYLM